MKWRSVVARPARGIAGGQSNHRGWDDRCPEARQLRRFLIFYAAPMGVVKQKVKVANWGPAS